MARRFPLRLVWLGSLCLHAALDPTRTRTVAKAHCGVAKRLGEG